MLYGALTSEQKAAAQQALDQESAGKQG